MLAKLNQAPWLFRQPLTLVPSNPEMTVSDLFIWRKGNNWQTYFDLINLNALVSADLDEKARSGSAEFLLMDMNGKLLSRQEVGFGDTYHQLVDISALVTDGNVDHGTFCVFHPHSPVAVREAGSFLTERGYSSYRYRNAILRSYIHGNLDAVAALRAGPLQYLGGTSVLRRQYCLQHQLRPEFAYEIGLVNPSHSVQGIELMLLNEKGKKVYANTTNIPAGGCHLAKLPALAFSTQLVIKSRLVMARPVVFKINALSMDVFHG